MCKLCGCCLQVHCPPLTATNAQSRSPEVVLSAAEEKTAIDTPIVAGRGKGEVRDSLLHQEVAISGRSLTRAQLAARSTSLPDYCAAEQHRRRCESLHVPGCPVASYERTKSLYDDASRYVEQIKCQQQWLHEVCGIPMKRLTMKNDEENRTRVKDTRLDNLTEKDEPPSLEEVRSWAESFDKLMSTNVGRRVFREFLRSEYSEENMLFWLACEDLKSDNCPDVVEEKARRIYEDYISILSPKEVSLDSRVRETINKQMVQPRSNIFEEAQLQIYTLMNRDSYLRFLNSQIYKKLLE